VPYHRIFLSLTNEFVVLLVSLFIGFNLVVIAGDLVWYWCRLHCKRRNNIISYRETHRHNLRLINKRNEFLALKLE